MKNAVAQPLSGNADNLLHSKLARIDNTPNFNRGKPQAQHNVKLYPDLNVSALKSKEVKVLALWYCLRTLNSTGSGAIDLGDAIQDLQAEFHYSHNTLAEHLNQGEGKLWARKVGKWGSRIELYSLQTAYKYFTITHKIDNHPRIIPTKQFQSIGLRNAWIYSAIYRPDGIQANPISRQTLAEITGLSRVQQRRYEKTTKVNRTPQSEMIVTLDSLGHISKVENKRIHVLSKGKLVEINKRLGNIYHSRAKSSARGMLHKVKAVTRDNRSFENGEALLVRRFFASVRRYCKALLRDSGRVSAPSYSLIPKSCRKIPGRMEWGCLNV
ncbi:hypothetical protein ACFLVO_04215 [Chloroflexota bacterium]